ncbi:MAG: SurA N-terminal domain-containing protein, partial [Clostridia bacterium]|nr:SurA N-terminal domain-containing protein [Clostridia bacterium]
MKRQTKKVLLIAVAVLVVIILVAGLIMLLRKDSHGDNYFSRGKAVATVNGAKITRNEFASSLYNYYSNIDTYNMYAMYYGYGKYYDTSSEAGMKSLKNDILNNLIDAEVYIQMAKDLGITLTAEENAAVAAS